LQDTHNVIPAEAGIRSFQDLLPPTKVYPRDDGD
jgi:hypothetical protein